MKTSSESNFFTEQIQAAYRRTEVLSQTIQEVPTEQAQPLMDCLEELQVSLEELEVAQEELQQQHDQLLTAQEMIESERQRYRDLFEFAPDGYLISDSFGSIREANQAAAALFQVSQKRLMGKPILAFVPEAARRSFRSILNELPKLNRIEEWEVCLSSRSQKTFHAAITVETMRDSDGQVLALRWLIRDVTSRKQAEQQLHDIQLQNVNLLEVDRLRQQFMATMSHELRTPLNAILGFTQVLLRQSRDSMPSAQIHMLDRILHNGQHLLMLIEDLLDFSKLRAHRLELQLQSIHLNKFLTEIIEELKALADQKSISLTLQLPALPLLIVNDPLRLKQIIINLISNAVKFTSVGGVSVEVIELPEKRLAIVVRDTGIGISEQDQSHIFQEFWQVAQSRSRGGTGLGLSITKALVELMQGSITVESQVGIGSTFRVEIPHQVLSNS